MLCSVTMIEDKQLIRQYAAEQSEPAFAELVRRHLKMVYAAALRQVNGDTHLAEDVAQSVFADLARKAGKLQHHGSIAGWLYASTRFVAANAVRGEARRRVREQAVVSMNEMNSNTNAGWNELRPMIDEALGELGEDDREAIVLRYFEAYEFSLVGAALGVSENAARMRVDRALEKLRAVLQKRGMATTGAALGGVLAESSATAVPAQLAAGITGAAMIKAGGTALSSAPSVVKVIAMKKLSLAAIGVLALSLATVLVIRNLPDSHPPTAAGALPAATPAPPVQLGGPARSTDAKGDPDILKEIVQRYDERARARQVQGADEARARWDKELADFENSMKEEAGVKKFGAARQVSSIGPNQTVIMGGWQTHAGNRMLVFITPSAVDSTGNKVAPPFDAQSQIEIDSKFIEVPEPVLVKLVLQTLLTDQNDSREALKCSNSEFRSYISAIQQSAGDVLSAPRVTTSFGNQATVSVQETQMIAGKNQALGPSLGLLPTLSPDGVSLDLDATALYTMAVNGAGR